MLRNGLFAMAVLVTALPALAADEPAQRNWPQFRGPLGNGIAPAADPPLNWDQTRNVRWKVKLPGRSTSTPVVWGDKVFIQAAIATDRHGPAPAAPANAATTFPATMAAMFTGQPAAIHQFVLICIDRQSGKTLWQRIACEAVPHERHHRDHGYASHTPVTDGKHVLAYFGSRGAHCYDMDGNLKWRKEFGLLRTRMSFGEGSSPAISGGTAVINWDHEGEDFILALDLATGRELWRQPRQEATSWSTPLILRHEGVEQTIIAATGRIRAYDLANGKSLWECGGMTANVIPTPVAADGIVYAASGFRGSSLLAIRLGRSGDLTGTNAIVWRHGKGTPYVPSPLLYEGRLYFFSVNSSVLSCHDAKTGGAIFSGHKLVDLEGVYASPVAAAGRIYLTGRNGATVVLKSDGSREPLAVNRLNERIDASPALIGKDLLLRGHESLYCISAEPGRAETHR